MRDEDLLAAWGRGEDAALWRLGDGRLGVLTVDFITPVVDDPFAFGAIAAANSLSDVWAMGGRPIIALNVVCFPTSCEPIETLHQILLGGAQKARDAGVMLAGGHSVQDAEPKYGLVVFGEVDEARAWKTSGARAGDALILTKAVGTGIAVTAIKAGLFSEGDAAAASASMSTSNDVQRGAPAGLFDAVRAATDVTGFGLAGHALDMIGDELDLSLDLASVPVLPGVDEAADMGLIPAGAYSNKAMYEKHVSVETAPDLATRAADIAYDPQTSGGMLLAVDPSSADAMLEHLRRNFPAASKIGEFRAGSGLLRIG